MRAFWISLLFVSILLHAGAAFAQMCCCHEIATCDDQGTWTPFNSVVLVAGYTGVPSFNSVRDEDGFVLLDDNIDVFIEISWSGGIDTLTTIDQHNWDLVLTPISNDNVHACVDENRTVGEDIVLEDPFDNVQGVNGHFYIQNLTFYAGGNGVFEAKLRWNCYPDILYHIGQITIISPDINGDGNVDVADATAYSTLAASGYSQLIDFAYDGILNVADIGRLASAIGTGCN